MSHLNYKVYPGGLGERNRKQYHYSQSVRIGDQVHISGQGGWDPKVSEYSMADGFAQQIEQAFKNVELALNDAGAELKHVYKIVSYHVPITEESQIAMTKVLDEIFPTHAPLWTAVGVAALADPAMLVEIEVVAHIPQEK